MPCAADTRARERARRGLEQTGVAGRVEIGAVVERIGVERRLHAEVAAAATSGADRSAVERGERVRELVCLVIVDQVTTLDHRIGA